MKSMLQEAMTKVQETECRAEEMLKEARQKGAQMIEDAKQQAKLLLDETKERALADAAKRLHEVKAASAVEKQEYASRLEAELQQSTEDAMRREEDAVAALVEALV